MDKVGMETFKFSNDFNLLLAAIITLILLLICLWYFANQPDKSRWPPGPTGLPLLGYLLHLNPLPFLTFAELSKKYGQVFSLRLGGRYTVVLNDYEAIYEAFVKNADNFANRPLDTNLNVLKDEKCRVIYENGQVCKEQRQLFVNIMKELGIGTTDFESNILNEIHRLMDEIQKDNLNITVDISELMDDSLTNIMNLVYFGKAFNYDHPIFKAIRLQKREFEKASPVLILQVVFPWLKYVPGISWILDRKSLRNSAKELNAIITKEMEQMDVNAHCYINAYLGKQKLSPSSNDDIYSMNSLLANLKMLYVASIDTTGETIRWSLMYMMAYPDVQKKVQKELDDVIGQERAPSINDRVCTPYTEATLLEIARMASVGSLAAPHSNSVDCEIRNYLIPKNTYVIPNIWYAHHDPKTWGDPENFRPERFLNEEGRLFNANKVIPFSIGKRQCLGEPLAKMELYLYFASLLKCFNFIKPYKGQQVDFTMEYGFALKPVNFRVKITQRSS